MTEIERKREELVAAWVSSVAESANLADRAAFARAGFLSYPDGPDRDEVFRKRFVRTFGTLLELKAQLESHAESFEAVRASHYRQPLDRAAECCAEIAEDTDLQTRLCIRLGLTVTTRCLDEYHGALAWSRASYRRSGLFVAIMAWVTLFGAVAGVPLLLISPGLAAAGKYMLAIPAALIGWVSFGLWLKSLYEDQSGELDQQLRAATEWRAIAETPVGNGFGFERRLVVAQWRGVAIPSVMFDLCGALRCKAPSMAAPTGGSGITDL